MFDIISFIQFNESVESTVYMSNLVFSLNDERV